MKGAVLHELTNLDPVLEAMGKEKAYMKGREGERDREKVRQRKEKG